MRSRSNLANTSSLLWHAFKSLPSPSGSVNWAGFYVLDPASPSQLILGPFHGQVACQTIAFGKGVCGTVAASRKSLVVKDVEEFPGHIPCDGASRSEIVVPILVTEGKTERLVGIIDIDCAEVDGFDDLDRKKLEKLAALVTRSCDWPEIDWVSGLEEGIKKL